MPWHHNNFVLIDTCAKKLHLKHKDRDLVIDVKLKGESVPIVSTARVSKVMKSHLSAYLIFVKERSK